VSGLVTVLEHALRGDFLNDHSVTWVGGLIGDENFQENKRLFRQKDNKVLFYRPFYVLID